MPGPRKNLTPLDMQMLGLAYNQGGIINFLGNQPEVTAPIRAQSHVDSPPTQLAYITDAEKDLLVNANIHGSMAGKPNQGPAGLESLDDFFITPSGGIAGGSGEQVFASGVDNQSSNQQSPGHPSGGYNPDLSSQAGGYESSEAYGIQPSMAVSPSGQVWQTTDFVPAPEQADKPGSLVKVSPEKQEKLKALALAKLGADTAQKQQDTLLGKAEDIKTLIMGGGKGGNLKLTKEEAYANLPAGMHPLRKQYEYLSKKYGPDWQKTTQAKELANYLSGVPVERGGGLGARDETYGGGPTENIDSDLEEERQKLLAKISGMGTPFGGQDIGSILAEVTKDGIGKDLTPEQYYNFRQQLMAADPTPGNMGYKEAFPFSSGYAPGKFASPGISLIKELTGMEDKPKPEWAEFDNKLFYDTSIPEQGGGIKSVSGGPMIMSGPSNIAGAITEEEAIADLTPATGIASLTPATGIASLTPTGLNYASMAPQFGPQYPGYLNQGLMNPNFGQYYQNLSDYYGYNI